MLLGLLSRDDVQASAKLRRSIVMGLVLSRGPESVQTMVAQIGDPAAVSAIEAARRRAWNPYVRVSLGEALRRLRTSA